ncbi:MAG: hypothetical protein V7K54_07370, partial [Nostoc sp.]
MSKDVNTSNPSQSSTTPSSSSSSPALESFSNKAFKADWNTSIFGEDALIPIHESPDTNKASRIKPQPVIDATIDAFNLS